MRQRTRKNSDNSDLNLALKVGKAEVETLEELNRLIAQVRIAGKVRYIYTPDSTPFFYTKQDIGDLLAEWTVPDAEGKPRSAFQWWLSHPDRRRFSAVAYEPDVARAPRGALNLYRPSDVKPDANAGSWAVLQDHLQRNVAAGDEQALAWFLDWCAHLVQRPGVKTGVAPILVGPKGCGKSVLGLVLGRILGPHNTVTVDSPEALTGRFNSHLARAQLVLVEEAFYAKDLRHEARLKQLVTGSTLLLERKGFDVEEVPSKANFIFFSNSRHVVPASGGERRFFALEVAPGNVQDRAFFSAMLEELDAGGYAAFLADLLARPIKADFTRPPVTALLAEQIMLSMTGLDRWWADCLAGGGLPFSRAPEAAEADLEWPAEGAWTAPKSLVVESAANFARDHAGRPPTPEAVGLFLAANVPGLERSRRQVMGAREHVYLMPPLETCRAAFVAARPGLGLAQVSGSVPDADAAPATAAPPPARGRVIRFPATAQP